MIRVVQNSFYKFTINKTKWNILRNAKLYNSSKSEHIAISQEITKSESSNIDLPTIKLLERLALVDLDGKEALEALESSIQFANKITHINTDNVCPLYCVLEEENLYLRTDQVLDGNCREDILSNAKVTDEEYFVSPPGNIPLQQEHVSLKSLS